MIESLKTARRRPWPKALAALVLALLLPGLAALPAAARGTKAENIARSNTGIVRVISGAYGETYLRIASDLAAVLNEEGKLRILPIVGQGSMQNIDDILHLKGIDVGIVQSDVLEHIKRGHLHARIDERINYIAKLFNQEFHLLAGPDIRSLTDLAGRKVSVGVRGSGAFITASAVLGALETPIVPVHYDTALGLEKLRRGEIAAVAIVTGKPADAVAALTGKDGLHLLPIPYAQPLRAAYLPAAFTHLDYPALVPKGGKVPAISVSTVMAVYNWAPGSGRYNRLLHFIEAFFAGFERLQQPPRHRKWREMSLAASVPGWQRYAPAEAILLKMRNRKRLAAAAGEGAPPDGKR
ncbi:MAG: TRAP transporter substrate-binding protein [Hyphomicrobiales bacterium]|nr:MAG: TRAP transporter substrate-binding protein [Hyphomicrobiales bacterium]